MSDRPPSAAGRLLTRSSGGDHITLTLVDLQCLPDFTACF